MPELGKVLGQTVKSFQGAAKVPFNTRNEHSIFAKTANQLYVSRCLSPCFLQEFEAELKQASSDDEKTTLDASAKAGEGESVRNVECAESFSRRQTSSNCNRLPKSCDLTRTCVHCATDRF